MNIFLSSLTYYLKTKNSACKSTAEFSETLAGLYTLHPICLSTIECLSNIPLTYYLKTKDSACKSTADFSEILAVDTSYIKYAKAPLNALIRSLIYYPQTTNSTCESTAYFYEALGGPTHPTHPTYNMQKHP